MSDQITLEEALKLVSFYHRGACGWQVRDVNGTLYGHVHGSVGGYVDGDVNGNVYGDVKGTVYGNVRGNVDVDVKGSVKGNVDGRVYGDVAGLVFGEINGREWKFIETPKEQLQRLLDGASEEELLKLINQMENN